MWEPAAAGTEDRVWEPGRGGEVGLGVLMGQMRTSPLQRARQHPALGPSCSTQNRMAIVRRKKKLRGLILHIENKRLLSCALV